MQTLPNPENPAAEDQPASFDNVVELPQQGDDRTQREIARRNLSAAAAAELEGVKPGSPEEKAIRDRYQQQKRDLYPAEGDAQQAA
jgi:hypothetical protein